MGKPKQINKTGFMRNNQSKKKMNPFEVHINKQKYSVLGKKSKNEKGLPGISRSRALKKRKATLLQDYKLKGKNNKFVDGRIGERDSAMTAEDKILARYTTERMRFHSKKSLYNLGDNEVLTHHGQSLAEIERFDDPKSDDEEEDDADGKLDKDFVGDAHFGGGMLKKNDGDSRNRKDLIDQLIAESKKRKAEKQKLREQTLDMTDKLDSEWKEIFSLAATAKRGADNLADSKSDKKFMAYDKLSKELIFEARGKATDKIKSEEEMAKEERKKLEELEKLRVERMRGDSSVRQTAKHRSADDLDDGFDFNDNNKYSGNKKKRKHTSDTEDSENEVDISNKEKQSSENDESDDEEESGEDSASENMEENSESIEENLDEVETGNNSGTEGTEHEDEENEDDLSDLKSSDDESDVEENHQSKEKPIKFNTNISNVEEPLKAELKSLPFTLNVPLTYEEFESMCCGHTPDYQAVVVERMVKSNHPSLKDGSRDKLVRLLTFILQHLQDTTSDVSLAKTSFTVLEKLSPWLFDLAQFSPLTTTTAMSDVIREKYDDFLKNSKKFPGVDTLVFFKLVGLLFPTSDYRHRIVTPTIVFMQHILASCHVSSSTDVSRGLFITTLLLEYTTLSRRLVPEAINFIRGVLRYAQEPGSSLPTIPPFRENSRFSLYVSEHLNYEAELKSLSSNDLILRDTSDDFKLRAVKLAVQLLNSFMDHFDDSSYILVFDPFLPLLAHKKYNSNIQEILQSVVDRILSLKRKKLCKLRAEQKKPKPLKLYEPKIEEVYTLKHKKKSVSKEKEDHEKLVHKYKKEVKGALREIRRDNAFLAKLKTADTKASDMERQRKVKEIFGEAAQQIGEIRKSSRGK